MANETDKPRKPRKPHKPRIVETGDFEKPIVGDMPEMPVMPSMPKED